MVIQRNEENKIPTMKNREDSSLGTSIYDYINAPKKTAVKKLQEITAGGGYERVVKTRESRMRKALRESGAE